MYENEDQLEEIMRKIDEAESLEQMHQIVTQKIYQEYFYFNPVYKTLLAKRRQVLRAAEEENKVQNDIKTLLKQPTNANVEQAREFLLTLPNLKLTARYFAKRKVGDKSDHN